MVKGDIVLIPFPFTDLTGMKLRPALILVSHHLHITVCFITSQVHKPEITDIFLSANTTNRLRQDSLIRIGKIATLDKALAKGLLGNLTPHELSQVDQSLMASFQLS